MIRFACACGRQLQAREEDAGRTAKCPVCDAVSTIPADEGLTVRAEDVIQANRPARPTREDRSESRDDRDDRPRRRRRDFEPATTSGKATAALLLGISAVFLLITAIPSAILGILALRDIGRSDGKLVGGGMAITGLVFSCLSLFLIFPLSFWGVYKVRGAAERMRDANNLKQIALSLHNHHDVHNGFPQAAAYQDPNGRALLSWRVALLPYVEEERLYKRFRLDESWDSPNNIALLPLMPKVYARPGDPNPSLGLTSYQVFVGPGSAFELRKRDQFRIGSDAIVPGWRLADFMDGSSNTILLATSATPVPWTKPDDMPFDPTGPLPRLGGYLRGGSNVVMADGSVRLIPDDLSDPVLRALITRNGGESVSPP